MTISRKIRRIALINGVAIAALTAASAVWAQTATFNIPSEDASTALAAWSAASGVKLDAPAALTRGVRTAAVTGEMDARTALDQMIAGTKLQILADDGSQITLGSAAADTVSAVNVTSTGTNIAGVKAVGSPIQRLNREDILKTGATSLRDVLSTLPSIQRAGGPGNVQDIGGVTRNSANQVGSGAQSDGTQSTDIGGQGARATLILVDGQRVGQSGENLTYTDINQVPISALGAVEVIPDGASAIYGTDAISGVVNLVLRRNYQGVSVSADYTKDDFAPQYGGAITVGKAWSWLQGGNVLLSFDSHKKATAFQNTNAYTALDRRPVGGNLTVVPTPASATPYISVQACLATLPGQVAVINGASTVPVNGSLTVPGGTITAAETIPGGTCFDGATAAASTTSGRALSRTTVNYGLPAGLNGATPTLAQLVNYATPGAADPNAKYVGPQAGIPLYAPNYIPADSYTPYVFGTSTKNILVTLQQKFSDKVDGSLRANFNRRVQTSVGYRLNNFAMTPSTVGAIFNPTLVGNLYPGGPNALAQNGTGTGCLPNTVAIGGGACPSVTIVYPYGPFHATSIVEQFSNVATLNIAMPYNWTAKFSADMSAVRDIANPGNGTCGCGGSGSLPGALTPVSPGTGQANIRDVYIVNGIFNPYIPPNSSPYFLGTIGQFNAPIFRPHNDAQVILSGPLFNLPGGTVRASVLAQLSYDGNHKNDFGARSNNDGTLYLYGANFSQESRTQTRGRRYTAEFYIPIVGEANAMPFVRQLTLDAAVNRQHLARSRSDSTDPQISWSYKPINDLTLRGTYGTSFRAPDLSESSASLDQFYGSISSTQTLGLSDTELVALLRKIGAADTDPLHYRNGTTPGTQTVVFTLGGGGLASKNPHLQPEHSTSITAGFDYKPSWLSGLSVSGTYRSLDYKDKIQGLNTTNWLVNADTANVYSAYIHEIPVTPGCDPTDASTYPTQISSYLPNAGIRFAAQQTSTSRLCDAKLVLEGGIRNLTGSKTDTATLIASYRFNTPFGTLAADTNWTKILLNTQEITPGNRLGTLLDYIGAANSLKGRSSVSWSKGALGLQLYANYVGPYTNDQKVVLNNRTSCTDQVPVAGGTYAAQPSPSNAAYPGTCTLPIYQVPSWTTFDLAATYRTNADAPYWRRNVRLSMNVNNFTGKKPPYAPNGSNVYDPLNANIQGRVWNFRIDKEF